MNSLYIDKETYTPFIHFNTTNNHFQISGESSSEDSNNFYNPVLTWLDSYLANDRRSIKFDIYISYYNTHSSQVVFQILDKMNLHALKNHVLVEVNWHVGVLDVDMKEDGEDFKEDFTDVKFNILEIQEA